MEQQSYNQAYETHIDEILGYLEKVHPSKAIILYGSLAYGFPKLNDDGTVKSDIDLLYIIDDSEEEIPDWLVFETQGGTFHNTEVYIFKESDLVRFLEKRENVWAETGNIKYSIDPTFVTAILEGNLLKGQIPESILEVAKRLGDLISKYPRLEKDSPYANDLGY
jgi:predicted nucleotidyltransferase